jgi:hypothetical protein
MLATPKAKTRLYIRCPCPAATIRLQERPRVATTAPSAMAKTGTFGALPPGAGRRERKGKAERTRRRTDPSPDPLLSAFSAILCVLGVRLLLQFAADTGFRPEATLKGDRDSPTIRLTVPSAIAKTGTCAAPPPGAGRRERKGKAERTRSRTIRFSLRSPLFSAFSAFGSFSNSPQTPVFGQSPLSRAAGTHRPSG